jgi:hypothetical protein
MYCFFYSRQSNLDYLVTLTSYFSDRQLKPGGWLELHDIGCPIECDDGSIPKDAPLMRWNELLISAASKFGRQLDVASGHKKRLEDAGFKGVVGIKEKWPQNPWPKDPRYKELGKWVLASFHEGLTAMSMALLTRGLGWTPDEVEVFLVEVRKDIDNRNYHTYWPM